MDSSGAEIMPPTMGAAMRCITSEPVPLPSMMGARPARITATVIALGRTRMTAPSMMASNRSRREFRRPAVRRCAMAASR